MLKYCVETLGIFAVGCVLAAIVNAMRLDGLRWDGTGIHALDLEREAEQPIPGVDRIEDLSTVLSAFNNGDATFVDARDAEDYARGHVAGAVLLPASELGPRLTERAFSHLPPDLPVIVYGQAPGCPVASRACRFLKEAGFVELRLFVPGWNVLKLSEVPRGSGEWDQ